MKHILSYKLYEKSNFYKEGDIILIEYWYNDMITPVIIKEKVGNKYLISHNIKQSKIQNAPDEKIFKSDIIDLYNVSETLYNNPTGYDNNTNLNTWNIKQGKTYKKPKLPGELIEFEDDDKNTKLITGEETDQIINVPYKAEIRKKKIGDPEIQNKLYMQKLKLKM